MIINKLELQNIRSYTKTALEFGNGKILLSGDIGSGKTTILLAIEFALFGLIRGTLSGSDLLRHGSTDGNVMLQFRIFDTNYRVFRALKRSSTGISQDNGWIEINGQRQAMVHTELKSKILEILGYPANLLMKNKNLIFRYTSYTPQEEVKKILYEDAETRMDLIRKIFGIDKYKNVRENAQLIKKSLRKDEEEFEIRSENAINIEEKITLLKKNSVQIKQEMIAKTEHLGLLTDKFNGKKTELKTIEEEITKIQELLAKKRIIKSKKEILINRKNKIQHQIENTTIEDPLEVQSISLLINQDEEIQIKLEEVNNKLADANNKLIKNTALKEKLLMDMNKIIELNECSLCLQQVSPHHKDKIKSDNDNKIILIDNNLQKIIDYLGKAKDQETILKQKSIQLQKKILEAKLLVEKNKRLDLEKKNLKILVEEIFQLKNEINELQITEESIIIPETNNNTYQRKKDDLDILAENISSTKMRIAELNRDLEHTNINLNEQLRLLQTVKDAQTKLRITRINKEWIDKYFISTVANIEKNILLKIYHDFNNNFKEWFDILIEDDSIIARLDDSFTPYIIQNSEVTTFQNLSGGEKTGLALAYRLALNKVINDFLTNINTRELLILDEPTDGFSAHQLDKIREVLDNIVSSQIIIVSHEPKLEGYVDEIIRVSKVGHVSHAT